MPKRSLTRSPVVDDADVEKAVQALYPSCRAPTVSDVDFLKCVYDAAMALEFDKSRRWRKAFAERVMRRIEWKLRNRQRTVSDQKG